MLDPDPELEAYLDARIAEGATGSLGSRVVAGLDDLWRLHVHTDRPDAVIAVAEGWATVVDRVVEPLVEGTR